MSTKTVVEEVIASLSRHGITEIFGQSLPSAFFLAAEKAGIRQVMYRTENAGGAMADGASRISGRISVIGAQNGPAATLLVPPMTEAMLASIPMLVVVQDVPTETRDRNAFQELDHFELFSGCAKWIRQLNDPSRAADYVDMAITAATSGRPGPVVLLLPKDVMITESKSEPFIRDAKLGNFPLDRPRPERRATEEAAGLILAAKNPIVIAGGGVQRSGAFNELACLQDHFSIPVATTNMGKGSVAETHPLSLGVVGNVMGKRSTTHAHRDMIAESDLVVLLGNRTNENGTDGWKLIPEGAKVIHVDIDSTEIGRTYEALRLVGDVRSALEDLTEALDAIGVHKVRLEQRSELEAKIAQARESSREILEDLVDFDAEPLRPERVMAELDRRLANDSIVVADASYSTIWMSNYLTARTPGQKFLSPRGMAGLGWGFPMALGAKIVQPSSDVICVTGDGGFGHVWQELETAVRENISLTVLLLNNSILGFQKHAELVQFSETTTAIEFAEVDHTAIARAAGAHGIRVETVGQLTAALNESIGSGRVTLIEIITDADAFPPVTSWEARAEVLPA
ncbi:acetolactate synthase catalytic subunit [Gulosibacter molinativorax]|uniref:Acetolactate synthase catalytic subunit n=1 Tax=Gulosibacter molinativorax TaxID=256821 RepID=A0ABT7C8H1_9MICO|nr:acetolactate synthase catalytic subunit [Gulosibacter molinativorax]MDJ1371385.1 acetolactate synthase catalytic subunit [Gulosibacter molinativorax]QUY62883.1 Acetolactate synthase catalytic subunit [Gulosibacter molinativorax]